MDMSKAQAVVFKRDRVRRDVWNEWKAQKTDLPEHFTMLVGVEKNEFDREVELRM